MNKVKSLLVLAAGLGSRYGGLKQMDEFGPHGESIIDYSIYDAIRAGFTKVVFVVREYFLEEFKNKFDSKFGNEIELRYVTQEIDKIPQGYNIHPDREKPWGTMHAVLMAKNAIHEPFCVINADDYYGIEAYKTAADFLDAGTSDTSYCLISYKLKNTLSEHGTVNRGVCSSDESGNLIDIKECIKIGYNEAGQIEYPENGERIYLDPETLVSMNLFAFYPSIFEKTEQVFKQFLTDRGHELKSEFYIPFALDKMIHNGEIEVKVLSSPSKWFGVTYKEDKAFVTKRLNKLISEGVYPTPLWNNR